MKASTTPVGGFPRCLWFTFTLLKKKNKKTKKNWNLTESILLGPIFTINQTNHSLTPALVRSLK